MLATLATLALSLAQTATPALPATCLTDADAWPACLGHPEGRTRFDLTDPAADMYRQLLVPDESAQARNQRLQALAQGDDATAIIALTQLGWNAGLDGKQRDMHRHYRQAIARRTDDAQLHRYRHLSYASACARLGQADCALEHWRHAAGTAPAGARWLPDTWALALWQDERKEAAIAWYQVAVMTQAQLGRGSFVAQLAPAGSSLGRLRGALFTAWSQRYATQLATVLVDVDIDAQGRVSRAQLADDDLSANLRAQIQASVARWHFEPLPEQGSNGVLNTAIEVDVRRHAGGDQARFDIQYVRMGIASPDQRRRIGLKYPGSALARRAQGVVHLRVLPDVDGKVAELVVARSSGHHDLDAAASVAVRQWRFHLPSVDGRALTDWIDLPVDFRLTATTGNWSSSRPIYSRRLNQRFPY